MTALTKASANALELLSRLRDEEICAASHHAKSDWHPGTYECPVAARWREITEDLRAALAAQPQQAESLEDLRQMLADAVDRLKAAQPQQAADVSAAVSAERERVGNVQQAWEDTRAQRDELLDHIAGKRPIPEWASDWLKACGDGVSAQQALHDVHQRHATRGTWTLYADEIDALHWLVQLHHVQLAACSYREFASAMDLTEQRMAQARAGNAPHGAIVIVGQIAQQPSATGAL